MTYLVKETFTRKDFYLLWLTRLPPGTLKKGRKSMFLRFLFLVVGSGFLAHWKNLAFTQSQDDKLVSIIGGRKCKQPITNENCRLGNDFLKPGVNGVVNFLSRVVAGTLLDRIR